MSTGGDGTETPIDMIGKTADQINAEKESQNKTAKVMFAATVVSMAKSTQDPDFQRWADMIVSDLTSKGMVPELLVMVANMATQQQQVQPKSDPAKDRRAATEDIRMKVQQTLAERAAANASSRQVTQQIVAVLPQIISLITELNSNGRIKAVASTTATASDPAASPADSSTSSAPVA